MKKESFTLPSADGKTTLCGSTWQKSGQSPCGILQLVHGMVEYIDRYDAFAGFMAQNGFLVVGHDHLGHGSSVGTKEDWGYFGPEPCRILVEDMQAVRRQFQREDLPYFILGHSMGSYLLRTYLEQYGEGLAGAIVMGTGFMSAGTVRLAMAVAKLEARLFGWRHRSRLLQQLSYSKPYKQYDLTGQRAENSWLTKDTDIVRRYYQDPRCTFLFTDNAYLGLFEAVLAACSQEQAEKIPKDLPILLTSGQEDPVGDMGEGVKKTYRQLKEAGVRDVEMKLYPSDRHEILNETDREEVYADLLAWIRNRLPERADSDRAGNAGKRAGRGA